MSDMILTFLLPLFVWHESFSATDPLESCTATDPLVKVAAMGVPVIVAALLMPGIVVVAFLATMFSNSNSNRVLRSSRLVVTSVVVAMAALVSMLDPSVVVGATSVPVVVLSAMMVVGGVPTMALAMVAVGGVLAMVSSIVAMAMCALVSIAALFFVVLPVFGDAPDCSGTTVVVAMELFFFLFDFVIPCSNCCYCVLFVVAFDDVVVAAAG